MAAGPNSLTSPADLAAASSAAAPPASPFKFDFGSNYDEAREVQRQILAMVEAHDYDDNAQFALKLALEEALINAVKHGNQLDAAKRVRGRATVTARRAEIIVQDEGVGFTRVAVPDPTLEENLEKTSGRGVLLIEAYMDEVEWTDRGRRIRMVKHNDSRTPLDDEA